MNKNVELLNFIHQNAEMGTTSLNQLTRMMDNSEFKSMLQNHYDEYKSIFDESEQIIKNYNNEVKSTGTIKKN